MPYCLGLMVFLSCSRGQDPVQASNESDFASQIGDVMASVDEFGGSSGILAEGNQESLKNQIHFLSKLNPILSAQAASTNCASAETFSSCSQNQVVRTFSDCILFGVRLTGNVIFSYSDGFLDNNCLMTAPGHSITRSPAFKIVTPGGGSIEVSKSGIYGQKITRGALSGGLATFSFESDGIRRVLLKADKTIRSDFTTDTTSPLQIVGSTRANRVMSAGKLRVTNNLSGLTCEFSPETLKWEERCTCPTSGAVASTCSDGTTYRLRFTSCGTGSLTVDNQKTYDVNLDRCVSGV